MDLVIKGVSMYSKDKPQSIVPLNTFEIKVPEGGSPELYIKGEKKEVDPETLKLLITTLTNNQ